MEKRTAESPLQGRDTSIVCGRIIQSLTQHFPDSHDVDRTGLSREGSTIWEDGKFAGIGATVTLIDDVAGFHLRVTDTKLTFHGTADWLRRDLKIEGDSRVYAYDGWEEMVELLEARFLEGFRPFLQELSLKTLAMKEDSLKHADILRCLDYQYEVVMESAPSKWRLYERQTWFGPATGPRAGELVYLICDRSHAVHLGRVKAPDEGGYYEVTNFGPAKFDGMTPMIPVDEPTENAGPFSGWVLPRSKETDTLAFALSKMKHLYERECDRRNVLVADMTAIFGNVLSKVAVGHESGEPGTPIKKRTLG